MTTSKALYIIVIIGIIVFFNCLFNNFVYDDIKYIQQNTQIHNWDFNFIIGQSLFNGTGQYRPIPAFYFTALYSIFGEITFFYHIIQLILHIGIAILLFFLLKKFFSSTLSLFLSLVFLVHPIQVESVSYISSVGNLLFFLFGTLALFLSLSNEISRSRLVNICLLLLFSFLTKETGFLFLFIVMCYRIIFKKKNIRFFLLGGLVTVLVYFFIRFVIGEVYFGKFDIIPMHRLTFGERLINIPAIIFYYLKTFIFPLHLAILQNWVVDAIDLSHFYYPLFIDLLFFILVGFLGIYLYKKKREEFKTYLFFLLWLVSGILFHSQILPLDMTVADRWFYFPIVGLLGIGAVGFTSLKNILTKRSNLSRPAVVGGFMVCLFLIASLSLRTIIRNTNWTDQRTLLMHDIAVSDDYSKEDLLAVYFLHDKQYDLAITHMTKSIELNPVSVNINNLGTIYQLKGDYKKAKEIYYEALKLGQNSNSSYIYINLANLYTYHDDPKFAIPILKDKILPIYPNNADFWLMLAIAEYKVHNQVEALEAIRKALTLSSNPNILSIHNLIINKGPANVITQNDPGFTD